MGCFVIRLPASVNSRSGKNVHSQGYTQGMVEMGRMLLAVGVALVVIGGIVMLLGRTGMPLGRLPGDILYRGKNTTFYFPLATSVILSILLSLILFLVSRFKR